MTQNIHHYRTESYASFNCDWWLAAVYLAGVRGPGVSCPLVLRQMEGPARGNQWGGCQEQEQDHGYEIFNTYVSAMCDPRVTVVKWSQTQVLSTLGFSPGFQFHRESWVPSHSVDLIAAIGPGNFMRDGKLVFIQTNYVCMFFLVLPHECETFYFIVSGSKSYWLCNKTSSAENPNNTIFPNISSTINQSVREITESTNDNYWFS